MDTVSFVLNVNTKENINDVKYLEDKLDFYYLDEVHELFSNENKKIGEYKKETAQNFFLPFLFALKVKCIRLNVEMKVKTN